MVAVVLDGKALAAAQEAALSERVSGIKKSTGGHTGRNYETALSL